MSFKKLLFFIILMNGWQKLLDMLPYNKFPSETLGLSSSWFAGIAPFLSRTPLDRAAGTLWGSSGPGGRARAKAGVSSWDSSRNDPVLSTRPQELSQMAVPWGVGHTAGQCGARKAEQRAVISIT